MKRFNLLPMGKIEHKKVDNFQRNACSCHLIFQNEANFSPREAYPPMKLSCKFGEPSWCSFPVRALVSKISLLAVAKIFNKIWHILPAF